MKRKLMRTLSLLLAASMLAVLLTGCGEKGKVKKLISEFEGACQSADMEEILDCFDPQIVKPVKGVMGLFGISASALSDLIGSVVGENPFGSLSLGDLVQTDGIKEELKTLRIKPESYAFNKDKDKCSVTVTYSGTIRGEEFSREGELTCVLRDENWYLAPFG